ncbi:hypothetical protein HMI54_012844 [Coelomomyces lativittatus]|nr:hypothetical protein HMI56_005121 [Coelomomyces lativittatus]KAJ1518662.1 hypothetical protein HMI54_012844 [Coelomomyces lativittatus]
MSVGDPSEIASHLAALDAVANADFKEKKWIWITDTEDGFSPAQIVEELLDETLIVKTEKEMKTVHINDTQKMNPPKFEKVEDMAALAYLNEASIVHNIKMRFLSNLIYTYSGLFLVAVNPYKRLPLYTEQAAWSYRGKKKSELPPHIFSVADSAYHAMLLDKENQSILITGESGAGKTENTKKVIQYLALVASRDSQLQGSLDQKIIQTNPILESFGNAQTVRNNNSSRFGKFIRIEFNTSGQISGAYIEKYLLEKSRVTHQTSKERNYHIFYQLLRGADPELKEKLLIDGGLDDYNYTKNSNKNIDGVDDVADFKTLCTAMDVVGFQDEEKMCFFRVISAVLHLGNITCINGASDEALITDNIIIEKACHLLSIPVQEFLKGLLRPQIKAGRDWVTQSRTSEQVIDSLGALARSLYDRMFTHLVDRINLALDRSTSSSSYIGVLDIAGFEIFDTNSFEQLCINYTNERLQQFFNHYMFIQEQEEYKREGIEWKFIDFGLDLQPTIDLIQHQNNPIGILACLDEECVMPKATDKTFSEKLHGIWRGKSKKYDVPRFHDGFIIHHYAGKVEYRTEGWIEKNKDPLNDNVTKLLANSTNKFIAELFKDALVKPSLEVQEHLGRSGTVKKGAFRTVAQKHKEQLGFLITQLQSTNPHFVRCIVPNHLKKPGIIKLSLILEQLRCNGVIEGIRICRAGFPNRLLFADFRQRYEILCPNLIPKGFMDGHKASGMILKNLVIDETQYRIGTSKVFFRAGVLAMLEEKRNQKLGDIISYFQAHCRGFLARKTLKAKMDQLKAIKTLQKNARIYNTLKEWPWWTLYSKVKPLLQVGRVDEELRRREQAIISLREQVNQEKNEKMSLETIKSQLETEKKIYEEQLAREKSISSSQSVLLVSTQERLAFFQEKLEEFSKDYLELEKVNDATIQEKVNLEQELQKVTQEMQKERDIAQNLEREKVAKESRIKVFELDIQAKEIELSRLAADKLSLQQLVTEYENKLREEGEIAAELTREKRKLEDRLSELQDLVTKQDQDILIHTQRKTHLDSELLLLKQELLDIQKSKEDLEAYLRKKENEMDSLENLLQEEVNEKVQIESLKVNLLAKVSALELELEEEKYEREKLEKTKKTLEDDFEELKKVVDDKNDQETKNSESIKLREFELSKLKSQLQSLEQEYEDFKKKSANGMETLRKEIETAQSETENFRKQRNMLEKKYEDILIDFDESLKAKLKLEQLKRQLELDLNANKTKLAELEDKLSEADSNQAFLEKQLAALTEKCQSKDIHIEKIELDLGNTQRTGDILREELEEMKNLKISTNAQSKKLQAEISELQNKIDMDEMSISDFQRRLSCKIQDYEALKERYNNDITLKVASLEDNKKKLDREVQELRGKLFESEQSANDLTKSKSRLIRELEDIRLEFERKQTHSKNIEKLQKQMEAEFSSLAVQLENERRQKELVENKSKSLNASLEEAQSVLEEKKEEILMLKASRDELESELKSLVSEIGDGGKNYYELEKAKCRLENELEIMRTQLDSTEEDKKKVEEIKKALEEQLLQLRQKTDAELEFKVKQHEETKKMYQKEITELVSRLDDELSLKNELLKSKKKLELELSDLSNKEDFSSKSKSDLEKIKKKLEAQIRELQLELDDEIRIRKNFEEQVQKHEKKLNSMTFEIENLEQALEFNDREKKKIERRNEELLNELEGGEIGSKAQILEAKRKLERDVQRLQEELDQESELRQLYETQKLNGVGIADEAANKLKEEYEEKIERLEENKRLLHAAQRHYQNELEQKEREIEILEKQKFQLQNEQNALKDRVEQEIVLRLEEASQRRKLANEIKEYQTKLEMQILKIAESQESGTLLKSKCENMIAKLEACEISLIKSEKMESTLRLQLREIEENYEEALKDKEQSEEKVKTLELQIHKLAARTEEDAEEIVELNAMKKKITEELIAEREHGKEELNERDAKLEQMRKKYQAQIKELGSDLDLEKRNAFQLKESLQTMETELESTLSELEEVQRQKSQGAKEKEKLDVKLNEALKQCKEAQISNEEYQHQMAGLLSQIQELRAQLSEIEAQKNTLEKIKKGTDQRIEDITEKLTEANQEKLTALNLLATQEKELQNLRVSIDEQEDRSLVMQEKLSRAELSLQQTQSELLRNKEIASDHERQSLSYEKQIKELSLRIVELEANALGESAKHSSRLQLRIEEISCQLERETREKEELVRSSRKSERMLKDMQLQLNEKEKQKQKVDEELFKVESKFKKSKAQLEELEANESNLQMMKRRLERELADSNERVNRLESEVKRYRSRAL